MKKSIFMILLLPFWTMSQIPVTDAAANAQLAILNQNVAALNAQMTTMNASLQTLLGLMQQNVVATTNTSQLTTQDVIAKRTPPAILLGSPEMTNLIDLKDKILDAYKGTKSSIAGYEHLRPDEIEKAYSALAIVVTKVSTMVAQATAVASTPDLIEPGLRVATITKIVEQLQVVLDDVIDLNDGLNQKNTYRRTINTLIDTN